MSAARIAVVAAGVVLAAGAAGAQAPARASWLDRVSVSARAGELRPAGESELFALVDRALAPDGGALRPRLVGGALHVRVGPRWGVLLGAEAGGRTVASSSRAEPASGAGPARQRTALDLTSVGWLGAEWRALRWRGAGRDAADRLRVVLGAGAGAAGYRLRQWGGFVDAERGVAYEDDFRSAGRGAFGYGSVGLEVPVRGRLALEGELRRQVGSAPMSADFAAFDRLDLGGARLGVGVRVGLGGR